MTRPELPTLPDGRRIWRGVDVSKWQDPERIDWLALRDICDFVVCRATYGATADSRVDQHAERVRRAGMALGLYAFFRPHQPPVAQAEAFRKVDERIGYGPGDLVPWLDLERDPGAPEPLRAPSPSWSPAAETLCRMLVAEYGECMPYLNEADFVSLGSPAWVVQRPLAVAHWTSAPQPRVPQGAEWVMWQKRVAPLPPASVLPIDQDVALRLIHVPHPGPLGMTRGEVAKVLGDVALTLDQTIRSLPRP